MEKKKDRAHWPCPFCFLVIYPVSKTSCTGAEVRRMFDRRCRKRKVPPRRPALARPSKTRTLHDSVKLPVHAVPGQVRLLLRTQLVSRVVRNVLEGLGHAV